MPADSLDRWPEDGRRWAACRGLSAVSEGRETHGGVDAEKHAIDSDRSRGGVGAREIATLEFLGDDALGIRVHSVVKKYMNMHFAFAITISV